MSSTYSQELEDLALASKEQGCGPLPSARLMRSLEKSSRSTGPTSQSIQTLESSPPLDFEQMELLPMSSVVGSRAKISVLPVPVPALPENEAGYGRNIGDSLANYDPATSSWRTSQHCLIEGLEKFSETWPRSGTMRNGTAYQLPTLAPLKNGIGFGSLPTPMKGRLGPVGSQGCRKSREMIGRDFYLPEEAEAIMKFPIGWTELVPLEMPSSQIFQNSSGEQS